MQNPPCSTHWASETELSAQEDTGGVNTVGILYNFGYYLDEFGINIYFS